MERTKESTTFRLMIDTDNAAFGESEEERAKETARILRETADKMERDAHEWNWYQTLRDVNGNDVGRAAFKPVRS